ncbi:SET domain-containing protein [Tothia fuscella]|uniref:SET domain-containing protein n=1 Tax=Tothia fuscella TaxID=1048955 RepID=A0A9P4P3F2_9PEZI|nr:SET domain-containing protein [Tothia fuscella]
MAQEGFAAIQNSNIPGAGRGLFASKKLGSGEAILTIDRPLLCVLSNANLMDTCANCLSSSSGSILASQESLHGNVVLSSCSRCKQLKYCGKKCQTEAWKRFHKFDCKSWAPEVREQPKNLPQLCRAVMELLSRKTNDKISNDQWINLLQLKSHLKELKGDKEEAVGLLSAAAWNYSPYKDKFSAQFVKELTAMIKANALTLVNFEYQPLGLCLDPFVSYTNHSCSPNACVCMDGPHLSLRTLQAIGKGEEILISYVDESLPRSKRQSELEESYFFKCDCSKCQRLMDTPEDRFLLPVEELRKQLAQLPDDIISQVPNKANPTSFMKKRCDSVQGIELAGDVELHAIKTEDTGKSLLRLEQALWCISQISAWPANRYPYSSLRQAYFLKLLNSGRDFRKALWQGLKIYFDVNAILYPQKHHPVRLMHTYTLVVLTIVVLSDGHSEEEYPNLNIVLNTLLHEALDNVALSHGDESRFAHVVRAKYNEVNADMLRYNPAGLEMMMNKSEETLDTYRALVKKRVLF